ncbi:hypothetical protein BJX99DRAFT_265734 [Aspergillus californicus]
MSLTTIPVMPCEIDITDPPSYIKDLIEWTLRAKQTMRHLGDALSSESEDELNNTSLEGASYMCLEAFKTFVKSLKSCPPELLEGVALSTVETDSIRYKNWVRSIDSWREGMRATDVDKKFEKEVFAHVHGLYDQLQQGYEITLKGKGPDKGDERKLRQGSMWLSKWQIEIHEAVRKFSFYNNEIAKFKRDVAF